MQTLKPTMYLVIYSPLMKLSRYYDIFCGYIEFLQFTA